MTSDDFLAALLNEAKRQGMTAADMSTLTGVTHNSCAKLLSGKSRRPCFETVILLANALNVRVVFTPKDKK